ncbi:hypothetical protein EV702DRAFT_703701 [Suillus placidus]|uniref:Uncharacterized protein n=1 Tax=Suillus placidus TaxID=48579 RepID=A0A9P7CXI2_9AGAM|nr:hypothetical protein EV702DRAFT_703701 [Suillus placidus]
MKQPSSNTPRGKGSSLLAVLVLSELLQYGIKSPCLLLCDQNESSGSSRAANHVDRGRHRKLSQPMHQHPQHLSLLTHQHPQYLSLLTHQHPQHLSLLTHQRPRHPLLLALRRQVQQPRDDDASHCGLVSSFFSVVHLPHIPMVLDTAAYAHLSHFCFWFFCIAISSHRPGKHRASCELYNSWNWSSSRETIFRDSQLQASSWGHQSS